MVSLCIHIEYKSKNSWYHSVSILNTSFKTLGITVYSHCIQKYKLMKYKLMKYKLMKYKLMVSQCIHIEYKSKNSWYNSVFTLNTSFKTLGFEFDKLGAAGHGLLPLIAITLIAGKKGGDFSRYEERDESWGDVEGGEIAFHFGPRFSVVLAVEEYVCGVLSFRASVRAICECFRFQSADEWHCVGPSGCLSPVGLRFRFQRFRRVRVLLGLTPI
ncbi:hypothetical protein OUZ56_033799 [Daphnia magna]|uniref:Uncharacterized protein n=1 Tax=Daphnia magna TaxID=35525 RepID=A0ABQ9ZY93_9CRUS|nr:hypothetical protein OUZ56_033799 [Daphnia magna]